MLLMLALRSRRRAGLASSGAGQPAPAVPGRRRGWRVAADYLLLIWGILAILLVAEQLAPRPSERATTLAQDCELFYGPLGAAAVQRCRIEMAKQHGQAALPEAP